MKYNFFSSSSVLLLVIRSFPKTTLWTLEPDVGRTSHLLMFSFPHDSELGEFIAASETFLRIRSEVTEVTVKESKWRLRPLLFCATRTKRWNLLPHRPLVSNACRPTATGSKTKAVYNESCRSFKSSSLNMNSVNLEIWHSRRIIYLSNTCYRYVSFRFM